MVVGDTIVHFINNKKQAILKSLVQNIRVSR